MRGVVVVAATDLRGRGTPASGLVPEQESGAVLRGRRVPA